MKLIIRSLVTLIAALAAFFFTFWMPFALILPAGGPAWIALSGAAIFWWRRLLARAQTEGCRGGQRIMISCFC